MLTTRISPKISVKPLATTKKSAASVTPLSVTTANWRRSSAALTSSHDDHDAATIAERDRGGRSSPSRRCRRRRLVRRPAARAEASRPGLSVADRAGLRRSADMSLTGIESCMQGCLSSYARVWKVCAGSTTSAEGRRLRRRGAALVRARVGEARSRPRPSGSTPTPPTPTGRRCTQRPRARRWRARRRRTAARPRRASPRCSRSPTRTGTPVVAVGRRLGHPGRRAADPRRRSCSTCARSTRSSRSTRRSMTVTVQAGEQRRAGSRPSSTPAG